MLQSIVIERETDTLALCHLFLQELDSDTQMQQTLIDTDLTGQPVKDLLKKHPALLLKIQTSIQQEWQGPQDPLSLDTLALSGPLSALRGAKPELLMPGRSYCRRLRSYESGLQFQHFRRSPMLKFGQLLLMSLIIAIFMEALSVRLVSHRSHSLMEV